MKVVGILFVAIAACVPETKSPTERADVVGACAALRSFHCPEGDGAPGGDSCEVIVARRDELHPLPLACWTMAPNAPAAVLCGSLRCSR